MTRIIAGRAKGTRLATPSGDNTRPTADRVREALFSSVVAWNGSVDVATGEQLAGLRFLDLFAGSGAVGLEASSRGADQVTLVESHRKAVQVIRGNATAARLPVQIVENTVKRFCAQPATAAHDVVWADPPYDLAEDELSNLLGSLATNGWLAPDALIVVERSSRSPVPHFPGGAEGWRKDYGSTSVHYCQVD